MRWQILLTTLLVLFATGCVSAVTLRDPTTGATVKCGPYAAFSYIGPTSPWNRDWSVKTDERQARCIDNSEKQGYVRVAQ